MRKTMFAIAAMLLVLGTSVKAENLVKLIRHVNRIMKTPFIAMPIAWQ